jgi:hypothetical protein
VRLAVNRSPGLSANPDLREIPQPSVIALGSAEAARLV